MNAEIRNDMNVKQVLDKISALPMVIHFIDPSRLLIIYAQSKIMKLMLGVLLLLFGFSTISWHLYRSAEQESPNTLITDSQRQSSNRIGRDETFENTEAKNLSDSLADKLVTHAALIVKTEPELALKLIKKAYQITDNRPPIKVRQTLATVFYDQLKHMPVLLKEFELKGNPNKLTYSIPHQRFLIYMEDGQTMEWSSKMESPKPYSVADGENVQVLPNRASSKDQLQYKIVISPNNELLLSDWDELESSAYIKNQAGEILGFFSSIEQISHASFGENDNQILTVSPEGKAKFWALNELGIRVEKPRGGNEEIDEKRFPYYLRTEHGLKVIGNENAILKELVLGKGFDKMEIAALGERILTYKEHQNKMHFWDMEGRLLQTIEHEDEISEVSISVDGRYAIVLTYQEPTSGSVYELESGQIYQSLDSLLSDGLMIASFSSGHPYMITHLATSTKLGIWDYNGNLLRQISPNGLVDFLAYSPDGTYFHTQSDGKKGQLWDQKGNLLGTSEINIKGLEFLPDESRFYYYLHYGDEDMEPEKRSLPTLSRHYQYLMEELAIQDLSIEEKARFDLID